MRLLCVVRSHFCERLFSMPAYALRTAALCCSCHVPIPLACVGPTRTNQRWRAKGPYEDRPSCNSLQTAANRAFWFRKTGHATHCATAIWWRDVVPKSLARCRSAIHANQNWTKDSIWSTYGSYLFVLQYPTYLGQWKGSFVSHKTAIHIKKITNHILATFCKSFEAI